MASRKPLCIIGGLQKELPSTDSLDASVISERSVKLISQVGHGFAAGQWVRRSNGLYALAKADSSADARVVGIVESINPGIFPDTTKLLLHCNGVDGYRIFTDSSNSPHTMSAYPDPGSGSEIDTAIKKFGTGSMYLYWNGTWGYVQTPHNTDLDLGSSDFAIDLWGYANSWNTWNALVDKWDYALANSGWSFLVEYYNDGGWINQLVFNLNGPLNVVFYHNALISLNTWHHFAIARSGNNLRCYLDGTQVDSAKNVAGYSGSCTKPLTVGNNNQVTHNYPFNGYLDEICVRIGTDNGWTGSTITIPTGEYGSSDSFNLVMAGETSNPIDYAFADSDQHWLSPATDGAIVTAEPSTSGQIIKPLMIATGTTSGIVQIGNGLVIP